MSRPLSERVRDWRYWVIDQALHLVIGGVAASVLWLASPILAGVLAALWVAVLREREQWPVASWGDLAIDVACTVLGGLAMGIVIWAVA